MSKIFESLQDLITAFSEDEIFTRSAALAFYTTFSFAPLAILIVVFLGVIDIELQQQLVASIANMVGTQGADVFRTVLEASQDRPDLISFSGLISAGILLFSASLIFVQIQTTLNIIFKTNSDEMAEVDETLFQTIKRLVFDRLVSIGILLAIIFIAIVSLVLSSAIDYIFPKDAQTLTYLLNEAFSFFVLSLSFCVIFKWMPDLQLKWKNTFIGAMITALLFVLGKFLIGLYIGNSAVGSAYGAAGSLVVLLVWVYYSSLIMFLGAEICWTSFLGDKKEQRAKA